MNPLDAIWFEGPTRLRKALGWKAVEARLIDSKFVKRTTSNVNRGASWHAIWDYMVEVPDPTGAPKRLVIRSASFRVIVPEKGGVIPVIVNRRSTKAKFDMTDARVNNIRSLDQKEKARKARDEERFAQRLQGRDAGVTRELSEEEQLAELERLDREA